MTNFPLSPVMAQKKSIYMSAFVTPVDRTDYKTTERFGQDRPALRLQSDPDPSAFLPGNKEAFQTESGSLGEYCTGGFVLSCCVWLSIYTSFKIF